MVRSSSSDPSSATRVGEHLAENLRAHRKQRGWSQAKVAEAAGLPRSTIANLEQGEANPTLQVLARVSEALGLSLEELLARPRLRIEHFRADQLTTVERGRAGRVRVRKLLPHPIPGMEIDRMELAPGARLTGVPHRAGTYEYLYCVSGEITLFVAGERVELSSGELAAFAADQKHGYHNRGVEAAEGFSVVTLRPALSRPLG